MCGIFAILRSRLDEAEARRLGLQQSNKLKHRGPDWSGICVQKITNDKGDQVVNVLAHQRLSIVDPSNGAQPLYSVDHKLALSVNGKIWNHKQLRSDTKDQFQYQTGSDCEPILGLYATVGDAVVKKLDGDFAFVLSDSGSGHYIIARDAIGICPLYIGWSSDGSIMLASEIKSLVGVCRRFEEFPPGHYFSSKDMKMMRYYHPIWIEKMPTKPLQLTLLRESLEKAVIKRMMCDVPYGVLLSGGLDSSLIASLVCRHAANRIEDNEEKPAWYPRVHSFSIGLADSPDLKAARQVSQFLGTVHHEFVYTIQQGLDALSDVIYHIETYDVTTVRASTPMFLLSRLMKSMGIKMVLSGEGSDEVFGGYLYFHKAPSASEFHRETVDKIKMLSRCDCLRTNKCSAAWGVEVRVPFLDSDFLNVAMSINPAEKMITEAHPVEKWCLRAAFDVPEDPYLPADVLWRQKEQLSHGVGYAWIDSLQAFAETEVTDQQLSLARFTYPYNTPKTKEAYLYRSTFAKHFGDSECAAKLVPANVADSIACSKSTALLRDAQWSKRTDPSGRAVAGVHSKAN